MEIVYHCGHCGVEKGRELFEHTGFIGELTIGAITKNAFVNNALDDVFKKFGLPSMNGIRKERKKQNRQNTPISQPEIENYKNKIETIKSTESVDFKSRFKIGKKTPTGIGAALTELIRTSKEWTETNIKQILSQQTTDRERLFKLVRDEEVRHTEVSSSVKVVKHTLQTSNRVYLVDFARMMIAIGNWAQVADTTKKDSTRFRQTSRITARSGGKSVLYMIGEAFKRAMPEAVPKMYGETETTPPSADQDITENASQE